MRISTLIGILILLTLTAHASSFDVAYVDSGGREWSFRLPDKYTNGEGPTVNSATSEAAAACKTIGGRLPSSWEYLQLLKDFGGRDNYLYGGSLDKRGQVKMNNAFNGDFNFGFHIDQGYRVSNDDWWTSTVAPTQNHGKPINYSEAVYCYQLDNREETFTCNNASGGGRTYPRSIRCVR